MNLRQLLFISVLSLPMGGCSTVQDWFASDDEDLTAPVELERIDAKVAIKKQWSTKIGDGQGDGLQLIMVMGLILTLLKTLPQVQ